ncbi:cyanoexosortase B system-associated protein [Cyanobacterium stanieri LEGE 03274]|uniref:Cyanoexosortase B system-associated protein n=1 Tax=Cyanobacterium stanieri LEGE 03274 TaxID=1828756 RepID=A0ABR9V1Z8_9CHRO|nr:cyanoexosortase B system-associated protein [Cyanobacterium stanieri]MBE9221921.1 cyanoexosortase B system-associated protein [Cyanobacterium stanieri LEGE 03274]
MTTKKQKKYYYIILIIVLMLLIIIGILPGYFKGGNWSWSQENEPSNMGLIRQLRNEPILLEDWELIDRNLVRLNGKNWYWQIMEKDNQTVSLLIHPQPYFKDKPSVEWTDLENLNVSASFCLQEISDKLTLAPEELNIQSSAKNIGELISQKNVDKNTLNIILESLDTRCSRAFTITNRDNQQTIIPLIDPQDWSTDSQQTITFNADNNDTITALFQRGWNNNNTVAMMNWYTWKDGGHHKPYHWFFSDLKSQIKGDRTGWVAISLRLYIEPLAEIKPKQEEITTLAQQVQTQIMTKITPEK